MALESDKQKKVPPNLVLTALLASGITGVISVSYIILSTLALIYRFNCNEGNPKEVGNAKFSWNLAYIIYIQDKECKFAPPSEDITQSFTVFILVILTLCFSVLNLVTSILLAVGVTSEMMVQYINGILCAYVICWVGSLGIDVTLATLFGMDYTHLTQQLIELTEYDFYLDSLRHCALILMSVALKGYVTLGLNVVLISLMVTYSCKYQETSKKEQHSIYKMGVITAFDQPKSPDNTWAQSVPTSPYVSSVTRGQSNSSYINDDDQPRNLLRSDVSPSQSFNRSNSWQPQPPNHGTRPFSYIDDIRRDVPLKQLATPAPSSHDAQWRRKQWQQAPHMPVPDYSPHSNRKLKSALKPVGSV